LLPEITATGEWETFSKELHLTEGRGTGIPTIKRYLERNQSPEPVFETDEQCLYFLTVLPVNSEFLIVKDVNDQVDGNDSNQVSNQEGDQVNDNDSDQFGDNDSNQVNNQVSKQESDNDNDNDNDNDITISLLALCIKPQKREEMFNHIGLKYHTDSFKRHIEPLLSKGWIAMTLPEKAQSKNQKYITTEEGKKILEKAIR
jgi:ATP-dependent DNA helicase RecG